MPIYEVTMQVNRFMSYAIEADSEEQAIEQINKDLAESCDDWTDYDTSVVHSMEVSNA